jgi:hypothetical protein
MSLDSFPASTAVQLHPVVLAVFDLTGILECLCEEIAEEVVVGRIFEAEIADVAEVFVEFLRKALAEILDRGCLFLLTNLLVLLLVRCSFQTLPWQPAAEEVHEDMTQSFQIVSSGLLAAKMGVDAHVSGCAGKRFPLPIWNMLFCFGVAVLLGHAEVDDVNNVGSFRVGTAYEEVVWLDVAIDEVLLVDRLNAGELVEGEYYAR